MNPIFDEITEKFCDIARQHAEIVESHCKYTCEKFSVSPEKLVINYTPDGIEILLKCVEFKIETEFLFK